MIKLAVFEKKSLYWNVGNNFVSVEEPEILFPNKWWYKLQHVPAAVTVPLDLLASYLHKAWNESHLPGAKT